MQGVITKKQLFQCDLKCENQNIIKSKNKASSTHPSNVKYQFDSTFFSFFFVTITDCDYDLYLMGQETFDEDETFQKPKRNLSFSLVIPGKFSRDVLLLSIL